MNEIWKDIKDYEGLYQVSNFGRVKSLERHIYINKRCCERHLTEKILKPATTTEGYLYVDLSKNGKRRKNLIHILVAQAFTPNSENKSDVHHIDHNKNNNHVDNLMWVTEKQHAALHPHRFEKMAKAASKALSIPVLQYTKDGQFVKEYSSAKEASRKTGINNSNIGYCCKGKYGFKTAGGYIWKYKDINVNRNGIM